LLKALERSAKLKHKPLCSQSALLYVKRLVTRPLPPSAGAALLPHTASRISVATHTKDIQIGTIWSLLHSALAPNISLSGFLAGVLPQPSASDHVKSTELGGTNSLNNAMLTFEDVRRLGPQAAVLAVDFWMRLGQLYVARRECLNALLVYAHDICDDELVSLTCRLAKLHMLLSPEDGADVTCGLPTAYGEAEQSERERRTAAAISMLHACERVLPPASTQYLSGTRLRRQLRATESYLRAQDNYFAGEWAKALRYCDAAMEQTSDENRKASLEHMQASVLRSKVLAHLDPSAAIRYTEEAMTLASRSGLVWWYCELSALRAIFLCSRENGTSVKRQCDGRVEFCKALEASRKYVVPSSESFLTMSIAVSGLN